MVKNLGEVALRVNYLQLMKSFYQDVLGLEVLGEFATAALLRIAEGYGGHTQVLGLFDRSVRVGRSLYFNDPEGSQVALGCYNASLGP